jgi:excisionase family DNA binding protein
MATERETVTVAEAAKMLGIGRISAYRAIQRGDIPCVRIGRRCLISRLALKEMLAGRKTAA